jgi:hypothetical protein
MASDLKRLLATTGMLDNTGKFIYSWRYQVVLCEPQWGAFKGIDPEMAREIHRQIVQGLGSRFLDDFYVLHHWNGCQNFTPLTGLRNKIPQCIHIRPRHWYVFMDGKKPVMIEDDSCVLVRKDS